MIRPVARDSNDLELVRRSARLTRAERTAAIRFLPSRIELRPTLEERMSERSPGLGRAMRAAGGARREIMTALQISEISGQSGRIDFIHERSPYAEDEDQWVLHTPGVEFMGGPGEWERVLADEHAVQAREPLWLLRVIAAATEATYEGPDSVLGVQCDRYIVFASLRLAARQGARPIEPPTGTGGKLDLERLAIDLWLDDAGRVRRATFHGESILMMLELSNFGRADAIELPRPEEVLPDED